MHARKSWIFEKQRRMDGKLILEKFVWKSNRMDCLFTDVLYYGNPRTVYKNDFHIDIRAKASFFCSWTLQLFVPSWRKLSHWLFFWITSKLEIKRQKIFRATCRCFEIITAFEGLLSRLWKTETFPWFFYRPYFKFRSQKYASLEISSVLKFCDLNSRFSLWLSVLSRFLCRTEQLPLHKSFWTIFIVIKI